MTNTTTKPEKKVGGIGKKSRGKGKMKFIIIAVIMVVIALLAFLLLRGRGGPEIVKSEYAESKVELRTISSSLSGSGTLSPANSYTVTTLMEGEITEASFEEGDMVEKDTMLYQIDSSDASSNIERSQISLSQSQRNYNNVLDNQYVKATIDGALFSLDVDVGDEVKQGQTVATIRKSDVMTLTLPFPVDEAVKFSVGQTAQVILDGSFETLTGTVKEVSGSDIVGIGNMVTRNVTINVKNPGGLGATQLASASINGIGSSSPATFTYAAESTVVASASGTVQRIHINEGDAVSKDQIILTLGGKEIEDSIKNARDNLRTAEISMQNTQDQLDNYTIKSPIRGTVVDKQYKAGDTIEAGKTLCTIYDLSYLEMILNIDELDISKVAVGQSVAITAEAVEGAEYIGVVTKVSLVGTTSTGGATYYPVTVRIDQYEGLRPGMNVDAEIVFEKAENVISIPTSAVNRGNLVLITTSSPSAENAVQSEGMQPPEGYVYVKVETGLSDDSHIQVTSGLTEGDTVAYRVIASQGGIFGPMGMPMGGGMPQGGMNGEMPQGGMQRGEMPNGGGMQRGGMGGGPAR